MEVKCPFCLEFTYLDTDSGETSCTQCGTVLENKQLTSETLQRGENNNFYGTTYIHQEELPSKLTSHPTRRNINGSRQNFSQICNICSKLKLNYLLDQSKLILCKIMEKEKNWKGGDKGNILAAVAVYIVCRQKKLPISLLDVSSTINQNLFVVGKAFNETLGRLGLDLPQCDSEMFIEKCFQAIKQRFTNSELMKIKKDAKLLVDIATSYSITCGRNPVGVVAASVRFTYELYTQEKCPKDIEANICKELKTGVRTLRSRYKELTSILSKKQIDKTPPSSLYLIPRNLLLFPFEVDLQREAEDESCHKQPNLTPPLSTQPLSTLTQTPLKCEQLTDQSSCEQHTPLDNLPKSYLHNVKTFSIRQRKIWRAKERLRKTIPQSALHLFPSLQFSFVDHPSSEVDDKSNITDILDDEDLLIEKLLMEGVSEHLILEGYYGASTVETLTFKQQMKTATPYLYSTELSDKELDDSLNEFIYSPSEKCAMKRQLSVDLSCVKRAKLA